MNLFVQLAIFSMIVLVIGLIIGFIKRVWRDATLSFIFWSGVVSLTCDSLCFYIGLILHRTNLWVVNFWSLFELVILSFFFFKIIKSPRWSIPLIAGLLGIVFIVDVLVFKGLNGSPTYSMSAIAFLFIALSLVAFYQLFIEEENQFITDTPNFWVITGVLVFFSGSFFSFLLRNVIHQDPSSPIAGFWYFHNAVLIIKNALFGIAFWKARP